MKKNILFVMPYFNCGGVETTLVSLLEKLDYTKVDVDLLLITKTGAFLHKIPKMVNIKILDIPLSEWNVFYGNKNAIKKYIKKFHFIYLLKYLCCKKWKLTENREENVKYFQHASQVFPVYNQKYDIAIDYFGYATFTTFYVAEKINAKKKLSWIHSRFSTIGANYFENYYKKYDVINAVSKDTRDDFLKITNITSSKVHIFYNLIDYKNIRLLANSMIKEDSIQTNKFKICTVGRLEKPKGIDIAIEVAKKLKEKNFDFIWYVVGEGTERNYLEDLISQYHLEDTFFLLGMKDNPYPYIKVCDIYVQSSRYEGYCTTTNEARILEKPIITTDVYGAYEQFINNENVLIVCCNKNEIFEGIKKLMIDESLRNKFKMNLKKVSFDYSQQLKIFYE